MESQPVIKNEGMGNKNFEFYHSRERRNRAAKTRDKLKSILYIDKDRHEIKQKLTVDDLKEAISYGDDFIIEGNFPEHIKPIKYAQIQQVKKSINEISEILVTSILEAQVILGDSRLVTFKEEIETEVKKLNEIGDQIFNHVSGENEKSGIMKDAYNAFIKLDAFWIFEDIRTMDVNSFNKLEDINQLILKLQLLLEKNSYEPYNNHDRVPSLTEEQRNEIKDIHSHLLSVHKQALVKASENISNNQLLQQKFKDDIKSLITIGDEILATVEHQ